MAGKHHFAPQSVNLFSNKSLAKGVTKLFSADRVLELSNNIVIKQRGCFAWVHGAA